MFNRSGSNSLAQLIVLCHFNIQNLCSCSFIRNCIAQATVVNILNKDSLINLSLDNTQRNMDEISQHRHSKYSTTVLYNQSFIIAQIQNMVRSLKGKRPDDIGSAETSKNSDRHKLHLAVSAIIGQRKKRGSLITA